MWGTVWVRQSALARNIIYHSLIIMLLPFRLCTDLCSCSWLLFVFVICHHYIKIHTQPTIPTRNKQKYCSVTTSYGFQIRKFYLLQTTLVANFRVLQYVPLRRYFSNCLFYRAQHHFSRPQRSHDVLTKPIHFGVFLFLSICLTVIYKIRKYALFWLPIPSFRFVFL